VFRRQVVDVIPVGIVGDDRHGDLARFDSEHGFFPLLLSLLPLLPLLPLGLAARLGEGRGEQDQEKGGQGDKENKNSSLLLLVSPPPPPLVFLSPDRCPHDFNLHISIQPLGPSERAILTRFSALAENSGERASRA